MANLDIIVTDFTFPAKLQDKYCKFRPVISVRYRDSENKIMYAREALPGLGARDYWECEKDNKNKNNYVRHPTEPKVDVERLDISQREIIFNDLDVKTLERAEIEVFDIDIKVSWEKILQDVLKKYLPEAVKYLDAAKPLTVKAIQAAVEEATGKKADDIQKSLLNKLVGKDDGAARSIWTRSKDLKNPPEKTLTLSGAGTQGDYSITLEVEMS